MASKGQKFNKYTVEFRQHVVQRYFNGEGTRGSLSQEYGISENTINAWIRAYRNNIPIGQQERGKGRKKDSEIDYKERYEILKKYQAFIEARREKK